jgi:hypothetical protein
MWPEHIVRGFVNPLPDRLSDSNAMDLVLSNGYNLVDVLFGTEYDDAGFYRLDSLKNLRVTVTHTVICGSIVYLFSDSFAQFFAANANFSVEWLWNLFLYRLENI